MGKEMLRRDREQCIIEVARFGEFGITFKEYKRVPEGMDPNDERLKWKWRATTLRPYFLSYHDRPIK